MYLEINKFWLKPLWIVLLQVTLLAACTGLPSAQLSAYLSVSEETETAGKAIYGALNKAVEFNKNRSRGVQSSACSPSNARPTCFDPTDFLPSPPVTDPDVQARILALETVAAYNDLLVALASGQSGTQLNQKVSDYGAIAGRFALLAAGATGGVTTFLAEPTIASIATIAERVETARAQFAVRQSLAAQRDVIKAITTALIQDTPAVYQLYQTAQLNYARSRPGGPAGAEGQREFAKIKAMHDSLGAYVVLLSNTANSLDVLIAALEAEVRDPDVLNAALDQAFEVKAAAKVLEKSTRQLLD